MLNIRKYLKIGRHQLTFSVDHVPDVPTLGITNECESVGFRLYLDYDSCDYDKVSKDIDHLHEVFGLCSFIVLVNNEEIQTNLWNEEKQVGNYNIFGMDRLTWSQCMLAQRHTRCDYLYKMIARRWSQRNWVLRVLGKYEIVEGKLIGFKPEPALKEIIHFPGRCGFQHCRGQMNFFKEYFNIPDFGLKNWDNCRSVEFIEYSTLKKKKGD